MCTVLARSIPSTHQNQTLIIIKEIQLIYVARQANLLDHGKRKNYRP